MAYYRIFFNRILTIDFRKLYFDDKYKAVKGITKDNRYMWIGSYDCIELLPDLGEVISDDLASKKGF